MRVHTMGIAILAAAAMAGAAPAWVGEEELPGPVATLRTQYRTEFEKGMAPIVAKCRQTLEAQMKAATIHRSGSEIALMKELLQLLAAGTLNEDRMHAASSKVPREVQITCKSYEGERGRLITSLSRRHIADLGKVGQALKTAGDAAGASVAAREAADVEAGELSAWGVSSRLAQSLVGVPYQWLERSFRFVLDGTLEGGLQGTWKQVGPHTVRVRLRPREGQSQGMEATLAFSEHLGRFEAAEIGGEKSVTTGQRARRD